MDTQRDPESVARRRKNFRLLLGPAEWSDSDYSIKVTFNGHQWHCIDFTREEFLVLANAMNDHAVIAKHYPDHMTADSLERQYDHR